MPEARDADAAPKNSTSNAWIAGPRLGRTLLGLFQVVGAVTGIGTVVVCAHSGELMVPGVGLVFGLLAWAVLLALSVVVHESGHYAAARLLGMHTLSGHLGPLELLARRQGFRWRWKSMKRLTSGAIYSLPDPRSGLGRQLFWHAAGGPAANLLLGLLACASAVLLPDGPWQGLAVALVILNAGMFLGNLVPTTAPIVTDGLRMIHAWQLEESDPSLTYVRLNALAVTGTTADRLPTDQVELLGTQEEPMPLFHFWFKLKGLQNQLRWEEAAALACELQLRRGNLPEPMRKWLHDFTDLMECEVRFSALMAGADDALSPVDVLTAESDWLSPTIRPRCLAALAAVSGEPGEARKWLHKAEQLAADSPDAAQRTSEGRIRAAIESRLDSPQRLLA